MFADTYKYKCSVLLVLLSKYCENTFSSTTSAKTGTSIFFHAYKSKINERETENMELRVQLSALRWRDGRASYLTPRPSVRSTPRANRLPS